MSNVDYVRARQRGTDKYVLLRTLYYVEYIKASEEKERPYFILIDKNGKDVLDDNGNVTKVYLCTLWDIQYGVDPKTAIVETIGDLKRNIRNITNEQCRYETELSKHISPEYHSFDDMIDMCSELLDKLNKIRELVR